MKRRLISCGVIALGMLTFGLASCFKGDAPIDWGVIIEKRHEPETTYSKRKLFMEANGKRAYTIRDYVDDEDYIITFGVEKFGKLKSRTVYVTKEVYDSLRVGDGFNTKIIPHEIIDEDKQK